MENLEFTAFCTPESLWQRQMLYFFFFSIWGVQGRNSQEENTTSKRRKDTSQLGIQVCKSVFVLLAFKKIFMSPEPELMNLWAATSKCLPVVWLAGRFGGRYKCGSHPYASFFTTYRGWQEWIAAAGCWALGNPDSGNPKGICHHSHPIS